MLLLIAQLFIGFPWISRSGVRVYRCMLSRSDQLFHWMFMVFDVGCACVLWCLLVLIGSRQLVLWWHPVRTPPSRHVEAYDLEAANAFFGGTLFGPNPKRPTPNPKHSDPYWNRNPN